MTKIRFRQNGRHFTATFIGHSGAKRINGNDLVCAAVSMLSQALVQGVYDAYSRGHVQSIKKVLQDERDGAVSIDLLATEAGFAHVLGAFSVIASGCALLAKEFSENVALGRDFGAYRQ